MKDRVPKSFAAAVTRVKNALGEDECAQLVSRSTSLVRKWADPDHPSLPNAGQALILDVAYSQKGFGDPPIFKIYEELVEDAIDIGDDELVDLVDSTLNLHSIVGDLSQSIREVVGQSAPGGAGMSPNQRNRVLAVLDRLEEEADKIEDAVERS